MLASWVNDVWVSCMQNALPDVLCVVQVALEGAVSKKAALNSLAQGNLPQVQHMHAHVNDNRDLPVLHLTSGERKLIRVGLL